MSTEYEIALLAPVNLMGIRHRAHPLSASSEDIRKMFNEQWKQAFHGWKSMLRRAPCVYCGLPPSPLHTIEHVVPRSCTPPSYHWDNLSTACEDCNSRRNSCGILKFLSWKRQQIARAGRTSLKGKVR